jgi:hypothetical protein
MLPPAGALLAQLRLIQKDARNGMACVDYPVGDAPYQNCICHRPDKSIWWTGLGCALIRTQVFEQIGRPWFKTDKQIVVTRFGNSHITSIAERDVEYEYGGEDIFFGMKVTGSGWLIVEVPPQEMFCGHAQLVERGKAQQNKGYHTITVRTEAGVWI